MRHWGLAVCLLLWASAGTLLFASSDARADWPLARHDAQRTAASDGASNIVRPSAYWRYPLGVTLNKYGVLPFVDDSGRSDVAVLTNGKVSLFRGSDTKPAWTSDELPIFYLIRVTDLNDDGQKELLVSGRNDVFLLSLATGAVLWELPSELIGVVGSVRLSDFSGDGVDDLMVLECKCCELKSGNNGFVYSFPTSIESPELYWETPPVECSPEYSTMLFDHDGDGQRELGIIRGGSYYVYDPLTKALIASLGADLGGLSSFKVRCLPADIDGILGEELLCVRNDTSVDSGSGRRLFALKLQVLTQQIEEIWQTDIGEKNGKLRLQRNFIADLDEDGVLEVVVGGELNDGQPITLVVDAATGSVLAELQGQLPLGVIPLKNGEQPRLLSSAEGSLSAHVFARAADPKLMLSWNLLDTMVIHHLDRTIPAHEYQLEAPLAGDFDADGFTDLVTTSADLRTVKVISAASSTPATIWSEALPPGAVVLAGTRLAEPGNSRLFLADSSGIGRLLDPDDASPVDLSFPFGGYSATGAIRANSQLPVVGRLGERALPEVVVPDGSGALKAFGASDSTFAFPPLARWERPNSSNPMILENGQVACLEEVLPLGNPKTHALTLLDGDGEPLWTTLIGKDVSADVIAGDLDGDEVPDLTTQVSPKDDSTVRTLAFNGVNGSALWTHTSGPLSNRQTYGISLLDWDNGSGLDVVFQFGGTVVLDGATGSELQSSPTSPANYGTVTPYDVDGDLQSELIVHEGYYARATLESDLATSIWSDGSESALTAGAVAKCGDSPPRLIEATLHEHGLLEVIELSGPNAGLKRPITLAGGQSFGNAAAALSAQKRLSRLGATSVHNNLNGKGNATAVIGSRDGWLYGFNPCTMTLQFSYYFGSPVGAALFGDVDDDGNDELFVSVADGYLYGMKQAPIAAPEEVVDRDEATSGDDVDALKTSDTLYASWSSVVGASSYEIAVVAPDGSSVLSPPWQNVGSAPRVALSGLALSDGFQYVVSVRAVNAMGVSPDTLSDGVTVSLLSAADAGTPVPPGIDARAPTLPAPDAAANGQDAGASTDAGPPGAEPFRDGGSVSEDTGDQSDAGHSDATSGLEGGCDCAVISNTPNSRWWTILFALPVFGLRRRFGKALHVY